MKYCGDIPDTCLYPENDSGSVTVFTNGFCTNNGLPNAKAGSGIYVAEMIAVEQVAQLFGPSDITINSDFRFIVDSLTKNLKKWEDIEFIRVKNADVIQKTAAELRAWKAKMAFKWVKGHAGIEGNEEANRLADKGRAKPTPDQINLRILDNLQVPGTKFAALTQSLAYSAIKSQKENTPKSEIASK
ncbi:hypothetical protein L218DRAFT_947861 [Marasmius fiardii PR-910]|nr:hypothetical protein L218DRAFT_947861 [Marasmius fiardii PR-910]